MNNCGSGCSKPENLKETPAKCSPRQIEACHGDEKDHCCEEEK